MNRAFDECAAVPMVDLSTHDPNIDAREGNTRFTAKPGAVNELVGDGVFLTRDNPADWRRFEIAAGTLTVTLRWSDPRAVLDLVVLDDFGEAVAVGNSVRTSAEGSWRMLTRKVKPGRYYLRVQPSPISGPRVPLGSAYTLNVAFAPSE